MREDADKQIAGEECDKHDMLDLLQHFEPNATILYALHEKYASVASNSRVRLHPDFLIGSAREGRRCYFFSHPNKESG